MATLTTAYGTTSYAYVEKCKKKLIPMYGLEDVTHYGRNLAIYLLEKDNIVKEVNSALSYLERMSYPSTKKNDTSSVDKLANFAVVAPICFSSAGKGKNFQNRTQGNRELYCVLYFLAIQQIYVSKKGEARNPVL